MMFRFHLPFLRRKIRSSRRTAVKARKRRKHLFVRTVRLAFNRQVRLILAIFLGYFLQVSFVSTAGDYLGVTPMLTISVIAAVTVCYGRIQAFWCGAIYGILFELMLPGTMLLNLFVYPSSALLWSVPFADKSVKQLEYERGIGKAGRNRSPIVRTLLCSLTNSLTYEMVNLIYIYLRESSIMPVHFHMAFVRVLATVALSAVLLIPLRRFFGYKTDFQRHNAAKPRPYVS